jgi:hypothetical protein
MNQFTELYKTLPTDELLDILDQPQDYQPLAVEAAKTEIKNRNLSTEMLEAAKAVQHSRLQAKIETAEKKQARYDEIKNIGNTIGDAINPISTQTQNTDKLILRITLWFGLVAIYSLFDQYSFLKFMVDMGKWDISVVLTLLPIIFLPIASILFWFRKKAGWFMLTAYSAYLVAGVIPSVITWVTYKPSGIAALDNLTTLNSPIVYTIPAIIFGLIIWHLSKPDMRAVYNADKLLLFIAIGVGSSIPLGFAISFL